MTLTEIFFYGLAAVAIGSSIAMVFNRNVMYSVLNLIICFFAVAGLYVMLHADFLAIVHIIVYAGAIMVLFLTVVMLLNLNVPVQIGKSNYLRFAAVISGGVIMVLLSYSLAQTNLISMPENNAVNIGSVQVLGKVLFNDFLIPFELSSILFISAMVGVVIMNKKEQHHGN
jgi:NADH-quinone oxidoreductase subunit J